MLMTMRPLGWCTHRLPLDLDRTAAAAAAGGIVVGERLRSHRRQSSRHPADDHAEHTTAASEGTAAAGVLGTASGARYRRMGALGFRRSWEGAAGGCRRSRSLHAAAAAAAEVGHQNEVLHGEEEADHPGCRRADGELGSRLGRKANARGEDTRRRRPECTGSEKELGSPAQRHRLSARKGE